MSATLNNQVGDTSQSFAYNSSKTYSSKLEDKAIIKELLNIRPPNRAKCVLKGRYFKVYKTNYMEFEDEEDKNEFMQIPKTEYMVRITDKGYLNRINPHCMKCLKYKITHVIPNRLVKLLASEPQYYNIEEYIDSSLHQTKPIKAIHQKDL